jgi:hypothetical protein
LIRSSSILQERSEQDRPQALAARPRPLLGRSAGFAVFAGLVIPYALCILPIPSPTRELRFLVREAALETLQTPQTLHCGAQC